MILHQVWVGEKEEEKEEEEGEERKPGQTLPIYLFPSLSFREILANLRGFWAAARFCPVSPLLQILQQKLIKWKKKGINLTGRRGKQS